jgi:hypothetical protein
MVCVPEYWNRKFGPYQTIGMDGPRASFPAGTVRPARQTAPRGARLELYLPLRPQWAGQEHDCRGGERAHGAQAQYDCGARGLLRQNPVGAAARPLIRPAVKPRELSLNVEQYWGVRSGVKILSGAATAIIDKRISLTRPYRRRWCCR